MTPLHARVSDAAAPRRRVARSSATTTRARDLRSGFRLRDAPLVAPAAALFVIVVVASAGSSAPMLRRRARAHASRPARTRGAARRAQLRQRVGRRIEHDAHRKARDDRRLLLARLRIAARAQRPDARRSPRRTDRSTRDNLEQHGGKDLPRRDARVGAASARGSRRDAHQHGKLCRRARQLAALPPRRDAHAVAARAAADAPTSDSSSSCATAAAVERSAARRSGPTHLYGVGD